jgi:intracellular septation protein
MNALIDLLPLAAFIGGYFLSGIYAATGALIVASIVAAALLWLRTRKPPKMQLITAAMAIVFGGMTLWLHNPEFIKLKFSLVYLLFAGALLGSHFIGDKVLLARIPQDVLTLPDAVWRRINVAWIFYFLVLAAVNLYVARNYSEAIWVKFKFACIFMPVVFMLLQAPFLAPYLETDPKNDHAR